MSLKTNVFFNFSNRPHLWHFQQASSWTLRNQPCPNHDWWCQHLVERRYGTLQETRNVNSTALKVWIFLNYYKKTLYSNIRKNSQKQNTIRKKYVLIDIEKEKNPSSFKIMENSTSILPLIKKIVIFVCLLNNISN